MRAAVEAGRLGVLGTYYTLTDGVVEPVWWQGPGDLVSTGTDG